MIFQHVDEEPGLIQYLFWQWYKTHKCMMQPKNNMPDQLRQ